MAKVKLLRLVPLAALGLAACAGSGDAAPAAQSGVTTTPTTKVPPTTTDERGPETTTRTRRERRTETETTVATTTSHPRRVRPVIYTVAEVTDGDTIEVTRRTRRFRVRLIGIDAPEAGSCEADAAAWTLGKLVYGKRVRLGRGGDAENTDAYGRLLRYVDVQGVDAGLRLIQRGLAVARYDSRDGYGRHQREDAYIDADGASSPYHCAPPTTTTTQAPPPRPTLPPLPPPTLPPPPPPAPPSNSCDPNYTGCVPIASDVDCVGGSGNGPAYVDGPVQVIGVDIYGLDGNDNDGWGCE